MPKRSSTQHCLEKLQSLCVIYKKLDQNFASKNEELKTLQDAIKSSSAFISANMSLNSNVLPSLLRNGRAFRHKELQSKHVTQVAKIGRYWDLCVSLIKITSHYPFIFMNLSLKLAPWYRPVKVPIPGMKQIEDYYIHAEIQLIVFYGLTSNLMGQMPRVLGVSKSACYLCDLFISIHGQFHISETHGRLYYLWTVPNLANYDLTQRQKYRTILERMHQVCKSTALRPSRLSRGYPPESTPRFYGIPSPIAASTVTALSQLTIQGPAPHTPTQNVPISSNVPSADNIVDGTSTPFQNLSVRSPLPSVSEIEEDSFFDRVEEECRPSLNGHINASLDNLVPSTSPSVLTINGDILELPMHGVVTPRHPYRLEIQGLRLHFEVEEPKQGRITVRRASSEPSNALDIDTMTPGTTVEFYREEGASSLQLNLRGLNRDTVSIDFEWLPD